MHGKFPSMLVSFPKLLYFWEIFHKFPYFHGNILLMVLVHDISGKIPMHFMELFFHGLMKTTQLSFGNFSTTANISMSISNSALSKNKKLADKRTPTEYCFHKSPFFTFNEIKIPTKLQSNFVEILMF
jgi:hypothetical protein